MSIGLEDMAHAAIVAELEADATVTSLATQGVHLGQPGPSIAPPYVVVDVMLAEDARTFGGRAFTVVMVEVRCVVDHRGAGVPSRAVQLAEAARLVMEDGIVAAGVKVSGVQRIQRVAREDVLDGGNRRFHRGGVYRAMVQPA